MLGLTKHEHKRLMDRKHKTLEEILGSIAAKKKKKKAEGLESQVGKRSKRNKAVQDLIDKGAEAGK